VNRETGLILSTAPAGLTPDPDVLLWARPRGGKRGGQDGDQAALTDIRCDHPCIGNDASDRGSPARWGGLQVSGLPLARFQRSPRALGQTCPAVTTAKRKKPGHFRLFPARETITFIGPITPNAEQSLLPNLQGQRGYKRRSEVIVTINDPFYARARAILCIPTCP